MFNVGARDLFCEKPFACSHVLFSLIKRSDLDVVINIDGAEEDDGSKTIEKRVAEGILFLFFLRRFRDLSYKIN